MADEATNTAEATADQTSADSAEATETSTEATTTDEGSAALGDAGKKALDAMKAKWKDADKLAKEKWKIVVLDEAQAIKNPSSQVAKAAYRVSAEFRVALSGTPVENRLEELWSLMHYCNPGLLGARADFANRYAKPISRGEQGGGPSQQCAFRGRGRRCDQIEPSRIPA